MTIVFPGFAREKTTFVQVDGPFGSHDTFRNGFLSVSHSLAPKHPLQSTLASVFNYPNIFQLCLLICKVEKTEEGRRCFQSANVLGTHISVRLSLEREIGRINGRLCGLRSNKLTNHIVNGTDEDIDVPDIFQVNSTIKAPFIRECHEYLNI